MILYVSKSDDSDNNSNNNNNNNNENKSINIQKKEMQVLKQESAILFILNFLASQHSQFSQLNLIENSIVENSACRFLYIS